MWKISYNGLVHGSIFLFKVPGKNPISSSAPTTGRVITIFSIFCSFIRSIPFCVANNVLPLPAGPCAITMDLVSSFSRSQYNFWFVVRGLILLENSSRNSSKDKTVLCFISLLRLSLLLILKVAERTKILKLPKPTVKCSVNRILIQLHCIG